MRAQARTATSALIGLAVALGAARATATPAARFIYLRGKGTESCPSEPEVRTGEDGSIDLVFEQYEDWQANRIKRGRGSAAKAMSAFLAHSVREKLNARR